MDKIIELIKDFFTSRTHSISKKLSIAILAIIVTFLINDHFGISYYFSTNMKIEHFRKIQEAKSYSTNDSSLIAYFNKIEHNSINRKTYIVKFIDLFDKSPKVNKYQSNQKKPTAVKRGDWHDNILTKRFPEKPMRSKFWNTITSSFVHIFGAFLALVMMIYSFFAKKGERLAYFLGSFLGLIIFSLLIWLIQWLFGLIPVIWNRVYINYTLNVIINLLFAFFMYKLSNTKEKNIT